MAAPIRRIADINKLPAIGVLWSIVWEPPIARSYARGRAATGKLSFARNLVVSLLPIKGPIETAPLAAIGFGDRYFLIKLKA